MYSTQELAKLHKAGKAHKLPSGAIIPTSSPQEVGAAIEQAKRAHRTGGDDDDPKFRGHLIGRAADIGAKRLIPASWAAEATSTKSNLLREADRFESMAKSTADPATSRGYLDLAHGKRQQAEAIPDLAPTGGYGPLRKELAPQPPRTGQQPSRSITVDTPALTDVSGSRSLADGLTTLLRQGRLGQAAKELALVADAAAAIQRGGPDVERYTELARQANDPAMRRNYEELAAKARREVRAAWA